MQESGVPNVWGNTYTGVDCNSSDGAFVSNNTGHEMGWGAKRNRLGFTFRANRCSNQYQSINEVRVKSIISNGYIKIF